MLHLVHICYYNDILNLVKSICYASTQFGTYNINIDEIAIQFDDSIIEDKEAESVRAGRELSLGVISKEEYRERIFGETSEVAKKKIEEIEESTMSLDKLLNNDDSDEKGNGKYDEKGKDKEQKENKE